jgi:hypothetical protein
MKAAIVAALAAAVTSLFAAGSAAASPPSDPSSNPGTCIHPTMVALQEPPFGLKHREAAITAVFICTGH